MKKLSYVLCMLFASTSCTTMFHDVPSIVHEMQDQAIRVDVDRDAIRPDCDVFIDVKVINKDPVK